MSLPGLVRRASQLLHPRGARTTLDAPGFPDRPRPRRSWGSSRHRAARSTGPPCTRGWPVPRCRDSPSSRWPRCRSTFPPRPRPPIQFLSIEIVYNDVPHATSGAASAAVSRRCTNAATTFTERAIRTFYGLTSMFSLLTSIPNIKFNRRV